MFLENRIQKINLILNILLYEIIEVKTSEVTKQLNISYGYIMQAQRNADLREDAMNVYIQEHISSNVYGESHI